MRLMEAPVMELELINSLVLYFVTGWCNPFTAARRTDLKACREEIKTILREELANFKRELRAVVKEELRVFERCMHASGERVMAAAAKSAALRTRSYVHGMMAVDEGVEG